MESDANVDVAERRIVEVNRCLLRTLNRRDSEVRDAQRVVSLLLLHQIRNGHIRVPDRFDLEDVVLAAEPVEFGVEAIQHVRHLDGCELLRDLREANDVAEEYRHLLELCGGALLAAGMLY